MATASPVALLLVALFATSVAASSNANPDDTRKTYIIHMVKSMKPHPFTMHEHWYASLLRGVSSSQADPSQLLYTYNTVLHGFAAKLSTAEAQALERMDGALAVIPSSSSQIHTTRSPWFLDLNTSFSSLWSQSNYGKDLIVGVVDTGIWPESSSFHDGGLGPVPLKWKGECQSGTNFTSSHCNNKIIGARYFIKGYEATYGPLNESIEYRSPRDGSGHGTFTASTVAGSAVPGANAQGFANGTAIGMASHAKLAVYKTFWSPGYGDNIDIAAAIDTAVADGVDILSLSFGGTSESLTEIDIATFGAMEKGVVVSMSAGNDGPSPYTLKNTVPWVITVGASNIDREFPAPVILGNLHKYKGSSFYNGDGLNNLPLVYVSHNESSKRCHPGSLPQYLVKDKIVVCDQGVVSNNDSISDSYPSEKAMVVKEAGGAGMIVANEKDYGAEAFLSTDLFDAAVPATIVSFMGGKKIKAYIESTGTPTATINTTGSTVIGKQKAPMVATFSSRGPSMKFPDIVKPDVIAPGVNMLAAWAGGSDYYTILSGTSMSCPHVSGVAALIRAVHPSWSPAAVKSALMTSSSLYDNKNKLIQDEVTLKQADAFDMGAGHVNPRAAVDPGLIYDLAPQDYIDFLCSVDPNKTEIALILRKNQSYVSCPNPKLSSLEAGDLNYPSFSVLFDSQKSVHVKRRTVTNVGAQNAVYKALVESPMNVKISVEPNTLEFNPQNKKLSFGVKFESLVNATDHTGQEFGHIVWTCIRGGKHVVRSPVVIQWPTKRN